MMFFRSVAITAVYELADSFRSRRALTLLVLYLLVAMAMCYQALTWIHAIEVEIAEQVMKVSPSNKPGSMLRAVAESEVYRGVVGKSITDDVARETLLAMSPIAVIYGWMIFVIAPLLVMVSCSSRVAEDVSSGAVRFVLFRSTRLAWCLGKFIGQAAQILVALLLGAIGAWAVAMWRLNGFDSSIMIWDMLTFGLKCWIYCLAYIGLAFCVSQWIRSPNAASALGVVALVVVGVLSVVAGHYLKQGGGVGWQLLQWLTPVGHGRDLLWYPGTSRVIPAGAFLLLMSMMFLFLGYLRFGRRDL